jgi:hypothetical protein
MYKFVFNVYAVLYVANVMNYSKKQIELLSSALRGDKSAFSTLAAEAPELTALENALRGEKAPMEWLMKNHKLLAAFVDASEGNGSAVKLLLSKKAFEWAAVANVLNEDENALQWLKKHGLAHYLKLAESIKYAWEKRSGSDLESMFKPFGM